MRELRSPAFNIVFPALALGSAKKKRAIDRTTNKYTFKIAIGIGDERARQKGSQT
jgi:hypothetical protein